MQNIVFRVSVIWWFFHCTADQPLNEGSLLFTPPIHRIIYYPLSNWIKALGIDISIMNLYDFYVLAAILRDKFNTVLTC